MKYCITDKVLPNLNKDLLFLYPVYKKLSACIQLNLSFWTWAIFLKTQDIQYYNILHSICMQLYLKDWNKHTALRSMTGYTKDMIWKKNMWYKNENQNDFHF